MTPAETALWQALRKNQIGGLHFRRQQVIDGFIADFYCHKAGLIVEADGAIHNAAAEKDAERDAILAARDLRILRFPNTRIETDLAAVLSDILTTAQTRIQELKTQK